MMRQDDPQGVMKFKDRYYGGTALVILGGPSGKDWEALRDEVNPDVILTANGNTNVGADFWMLAENMNYQYQMALHGKNKKIKERGKDFMRLLTTSNSAKTRLISCLSWNLLDVLGVDKSNCICIRRMCEVADDYFSDNFSLREYGDGFLNGPIVKHTEGLPGSVRYNVGTIAAHLLHMAGILGCFEVHTIGMDFCFKNGKHHWYPHPEYGPYKFRTEKMFIEHEGLQTMWEWVEGAEWFNSLEWLFETENLFWADHSDGLLQAMGVWSAS